MRKTFETEIQKLKDEMLVLGSMVEQQILGSVEALKKRDLDASRHIREVDDQVNARRYAIEEQVMIVIATQQPLAHDLRLLASILEVSGELERMGDYAKGIATVSIRMGDQPLLKPLIDIPRMAEQTVDMLRRSLDAFINHNTEVARKISTEDDVIDQLYDQIFSELLNIMLEDPKTITRATRLIWVAHDLERSADRVTNICERVIFVETGKMEEIQAEKYYLG